MMKMVIMTQPPIHAGDRVVIVHGPDCEPVVMLKGYSGPIPAAYIARIRDDAYPGYR